MSARKVHSFSRILVTLPMLVGATTLTAIAGDGVISNIEFCNNFSQDVAVAIAYPDPENDAWPARGWLQLSPGNCASYDPGFYVREFYYHAETDSYDLGNGKTGRMIWGSKGDKQLYVGDGDFDFKDAAKSTNEESQPAKFSRFISNSALLQGQYKASVTLEANGSVRSSIEAAGQ
jgi:uncharacterized membrane protein